MEITIEYQPIFEAPAASDKRRNTSDEPRATINMQNKPNLLNARMNVSSAITMNYEQLTMNYANKNKPNSKPIQTQSKPIKANKNKPNSKPIQTQSKPTCSELAHPELVEGVEPISKAKKCCCV